MGGHRCRSAGPSCHALASRLFQGTAGPKSHHVRKAEGVPMMRSGTRRGVAALLTAGMFGLVLLIVGPHQPEGSGQPPPPARKPRPPGKPIAMPANPVGLEVELGLKDTAPTQWDGEVELSGGKLVAMSVRRGGPNAKADGPRF